jgi:glutamate-1-semialdehyde 2,1-aminomutase
LFVKIVAIVQARMGSTRLPGKVMKHIVGAPMIELLLKRLARSTELDLIVVATSVDPRNEQLINHSAKLGFACVQGSENDVLERYIQAAELHQADIIVRITGDCPLVDPELVDECIRRFRDSKADYLSNINPPTYPDGLDVEVFRLSALRESRRNTKKLYDREHVTPYLRESGQFHVVNISHEKDLSKLRWTVDDPEDFEVVKNIFEHFSPNIYFKWSEAFTLQQQNPGLFAANKHTQRNQGAAMGTGPKLWQRAKRVIPGGNMLLSKRAEMFLPNQWPAYFSKAKGCRVWDLDGREYIDMSIMGIGTNILGYGHPEVDEAVVNTVRDGNMSTFNCPEEVYLAERLVEMHPWADMARLARSGGEANAIAIRIARAASGKDKVAICGYHGWHDWYLAANLGDEQNLAGHLLPGLEPKGVPKNLSGSVLPFHYNDYEALEGLVRVHDIGVIKMEVSRNAKPENGFLEKVRKLATDHGIVLIFDECTSGFRQSFGGLHKIYGVEPDMAMFGKALGNGYAITATIGRREVMQAAQDTFISSTFWTERIGPSAALKTLDVMEREKSWEYITRIGEQIGGAWRVLAARHELPIEVSGLPAMIGFAFPLPDMLKYRTLITQEMLKKGFLAATAVYTCTEHGQAEIDQYFSELDPIFALIKECETGRNIDDLLESPVCHGGFKRLN